MTSDEMVAYRQIVLDAGRFRGGGTLEQSVRARAEWCFWKPDGDIDEFHRLVDRAVGVVVRRYRKPDGDDASLVDAFERIAVLPGERPADHAEWMARWAFRGHPQVDAIAQGVRWTREFIDWLAEGARRTLSAREQSLRGRFLRNTELALEGRNGVRNTPLRVARVIEQTPAEDFVDIALEGDRDALYQAIHEAGCDALDWVWVRRALEAWRVAGSDPDHSAGERAQARENLVGVGKALAHGMGRGRVREGAIIPTKRDLIRDARPVLVDLLASRRMPRVVPEPLVRAGLAPAAIEAGLGKLADETPQDVADQILHERFGGKISTIRRYGARPSTAER